MLFFLLQSALAVPQQLSQQGRLLDSAGTPIEGTQNLTFSVYEYHLQHLFGRKP